MFPKLDTPQRGLFFSFEGIDGSGKSTQARLLSESLIAMGEQVVTVREPGGTRLGEGVRALLLDPNADISERAELFLFLAARAEVVAAIIDPALANGTHVIADRFADSTLAYQGAGRGMASSIPLDVLNSVATQSRVPNRTYMIDVPVAEAMRRRISRPQDRMEQPTMTLWNASALNTERFRNATRHEFSLSMGGRLSRHSIA